MTKAKAKVLIVILMTTPSTAMMLLFLAYGLSRRLMVESLAMTLVMMAGWLIRMIAEPYKLTRYQLQTGTAGAAGIKTVSVIDSAVMDELLSSAAGEQIILNRLSKSPAKWRAALRVGS